MTGRLALAAGIGLLAACGGGGSDSTLDLPLGDLFDGYPPPSLELVLLESPPPLAPVSPDPSIVGYVVTPPLPLGLVLDATTGEITGAPQVVTQLTEYLVTAFSDVEQDPESFILRVRAPVVTLSSDVPLIRAATIAGTPVPSTPATLAPVAPAPAPLDLGTTLLDAPVAGVELITLPGPPPTDAAVPPPAPHLATSDFVATIAVESTELPAAPWQLAGVGPYAGVAAALPDFTIDTAATPLATGLLSLSLSLSSPPVAPFATEPISTVVRESSPASSGLANTSRDACLVAGRLYFIASTDLVHQDLHRFDPGAPALDRLTDVEAAGGFFTSLAGAFGDWVVYESDLGFGLEKPFLHDVATGATAQISDLNPSSSDGAHSFVRLDGALYFVAGPSFLQRHLYRFVPAGPSSVASLERVSFTASDGDDAPQDPTIFGGEIYYSARHAATGERHLFRFDPVLGTQERLSTSAQADVGPIRSLSGNLFVLADGSGGARKLHRLDPATDGLVQLTDLAGNPAVSDDVQFLEGSEDRLFFRARTAAGPRKLFALDPDTGDLTQVSDTAAPSASDGILEVLEAGTDVYFAARNASGSSKLYHTNLTTGVQTQLLDANGPDTDDSPCDFVLRANGTLALAVHVVATGGFSMVEVPSLVSPPLVVGDPFGPLEEDDVAPLLETDGKLYYVAGPNDARVLYALDS